MTSEEFTILAKALTDANVENERLRAHIRSLEIALAEAAIQMEEAGLI